MGFSVEEGPEIETDYYNLRHLISLLIIQRETAGILYT